MQDDLSEEERQQENFVCLARLYVLADVLGDLKSANTVIDQVIRYSDDTVRVPGARCATFVMKATPESSPLQRLMIDYYTQEAGEQAFERDSNGEQMSSEFLAAVAREYRRLVTAASGEDTVEGTFKTSINKRHKCYYHQHDASCPKC